MSCGLIKRLAAHGTVFSQSVNVHNFFTRTSHSVLDCGPQSVYAAKAIPLSTNIPQVVMSGRASALPGLQRVATERGEDTDGLFVTNAGIDRASSEVLERPADVGGIAIEQNETNKDHSACGPAISAYKEVFNKAAMDGPGESVSKVEAHADKVGKFEGQGLKVEGVGKTVGKSEEDTVSKVEQMGKSIGKSEAENVGKTQGTESEAVGKFEGKGPNVGKSERSTGKVEGVGKAVGKSEEDTVGKSIGKSEGKTIGKTQRAEGEAVGKSVGKAEKQVVEKRGKNNETGKAVAEVEGDVGTSTGKSVGKAAEGDVGKALDKSVGKGEVGDVGKSSQKSLGHEVGKAGGNIQKQTVGNISNTENSKEFVIVAAGKSESEIGYVEGLIAAGELKLPEGATLAAYEQTVPTEDGFRVHVFMDQLMTRQFGRLLFYARELPSTHTLLSQNCKSLPVGTLSVADVQFQGKGRAGNSWESPKGCLMFSFTLQMSDGRAVPFLQYVASLAIIEGIESHCMSKGLKSPEVKIKWPNDLYAKGLKVGGVLCTSTYSSKKFNIVVGVGLNVGNRQPTTCLDALIEEINEETPSLSRDELLAAIITKFEKLFEVFCSQGFFVLESDYYRRWLHSGQTVVLEERLEGDSEVSHVSLKIQGLTPSGYLRAVDDASEAYELHPDGNSFDFLKGLMRKKM